MRPSSLVAEGSLEEAVEADSSGSGRDVLGRLEELLEPVSTKGEDQRSFGRGEARKMRDSPLEVGERRSISLVVLAVGGQEGQLDSTLILAKAF